MAGKAEIKTFDGKKLMLISTVDFRTNMAGVFRELDARTIDEVHLTNHGLVAKIILLPPDYRPEKLDDGAFEFP